jgi:hypothetical protein
MYLYAVTLGEAEDNDYAFRLRDTRNKYQTLVRF